MLRHRNKERLYFLVVTPQCVSIKVLSLGCSISDWLFKLLIELPVNFHGEKNSSEMNFCLELGQNFQPSLKWSLTYVCHFFLMMCLYEAVLSALTIIKQNIHQLQKTLKKLCIPYAKL